MKFGHEILKYRDDILRDLAKLIAVPSVCTHPLPGKPFGEAPAQALECILSMAKNMGFETENTDNYAGAVYYGTGTEYVDVLTHVDVVPAGDGWDTDPFQMVIKDGMAYGRGVSDDKGAAIVALYCLKALKDAGIPGKICTPYGLRFRRGDRQRRSGPFLYEASLPGHGLYAGLRLRNLPV